MVFSLFLSPVDVQAQTTVDTLHKTGSYVTGLTVSGLLGTGAVPFNYDEYSVVGFNVGLATNKYYILNMHLVSNVQKHLGGGTGDADVTVVPYVILNGVKYYVGEWYGLLVQGSSSNNMVLGYEIFGSVWSNSQSTPTTVYYTIDTTLDISIIELDASEVASSVVQNNINNSIQQGNQLQKEANETGKGILGKITDFFGSFFENIINALKSLFIPEDGYFSDFFTRLNDFFSEKLGFLYEPIELFLNFLNAIQNASVGASPGLTFPEIKWEDDVIVPETRVDFSVVNEAIPELQDKIYFVTDIIMVGAVLILLEKKIDEVMHK